LKFLHSWDAFEVYLCPLKVFTVKFFHTGRLNFVFHQENVFIFGRMKKLYSKQEEASIQTNENILTLTRNHYYYAVLLLQISHYIVNIEINFIFYFFTCKMRQKGVTK